MKKFLLILIIIISFGMVPQANALDLNFFDAYYLGHINDGAPANPTTDVENINFLITLGAGDGITQLPAGTGELYDRLFSTLPNSGFPTAVLAGSDKDDSSNNKFNITTGSFQYILGKYDGRNAGAYVWYDSIGFSGPISVPTHFGQYGLSHTGFYNPKNGGGVTPVPEPTTVLLLGAGLMGLAAVGRKKFKIKK